MIKISEATGAPKTSLETKNQFSCSVMQDAKLYVFWQAVFIYKNYFYQYQGS